MKRIGIDIGSTTAKIAALDDDGNIIFSSYKRHNAKAKDVVTDTLSKLAEDFGNEKVSVRLTGSIGMGFAEMCSLPFVQEVVAAKKAIQKNYPNVATMIDIGGEDAKVVFFSNGDATDLRMNGNCAGGTGAFIDQMAIILGITVDELGELALKAGHVYPIASRCGVFCKTDVQNLIAKNATREDIAASIFHAVAVQTVVTLAHGADIGRPLLFCGGPLTFLPALRKAFKDYLQLSDSDIIMPENGNLLPAIGSALSEIDDEKPMTVAEIIKIIDEGFNSRGIKRSGLAPIFTSKEDYDKWHERISGNKVQTAELLSGSQNVFLGIDSGSTTTKIVVTDERMRIVYSFYCANGGNPIKAVENGLNGLKAECRKHGTNLNIIGSCSTGYGEDLIKTAFSLHGSIIETIAHYMAARYLNKNVSFILDIGGQDMKAIFVSKGVIDRIEINESCSSGCGSFISAFANSLGHSVQDFAESACTSQNPCDLGTRCTVFMNSRVKQVLREGATVNDIAAGLAYSVVKNCIYKVLKLKNADALGDNIVVQGGTMRNDAVVRALEELTGANVTRCDVPELMGAFGCALYAAQKMKNQKVNGTEKDNVFQPLKLEDIISKAHFESRLLNCHGCENNCLVVRYKFDNGKCYFSGNRCERVFSNSAKGKRVGVNVYEKKYKLLFGESSAPLNEKNNAEAADNTEEKYSGILKNESLNIGIPRMLNMFEDYPFWHSMFTECGINVVLSGDSVFADYEHCARMVMSDNICFPAKLAHSHVQELINKHVDRIFMPFVVFEHNVNGQNSYNCPIVTGYPEVVKSVQNEGIPIDSPTINFKDEQLLLKQLNLYFGSLGIDKHTIKVAFEKAKAAQSMYERKLVEMNEQILRDKTDKHSFTIMLVGRPYHTDPLIQHNVSRMLSEMGIDVITDDIVRDKDIDISDVHFISQWTYPNRILKAAKWCALQGPEMQFVEMTSFGCGPDAFLTDEVRDLLLRYGKALTLLKLDDINNIGSMKLRVRSLVESMKLASEEQQIHRQVKPFKDVPPFDERYRNRKILAPFFTPFISPLIPAMMKVVGYDCENLPMSDAESSEYGLKYANNEVCYPATLIVGDMIKAFKSGRYKPEECAVAITQTGGQCRASNYISLIKKAMVDAGYGDVPVISLAMDSSLGNNQPAFKMDWMKILPVAMRAMLYSDCISKFYYATLIREKVKGQANRLKDKYLEIAANLISSDRSKELYRYLTLAAEDFNRACREVEFPKVGIVGEIFLKFNPFAHKNLMQWLTDKGVEVVPPILADFFTQSFVNTKVKCKSFVEKKSMPNFLLDFIYKLVKHQINKVNGIGKKFRYYIPFGDIFEEAEEARSIINLNTQFGEGWLLPAEAVSYHNMGINHVLSLQPFGCIANHIISKGIEKKLKSVFPDMFMLSLDFDSGVSDVNITNRMLLFIDNLKKHDYAATAKQR